MAMIVLVTLLLLLLVLALLLRERRHLVLIRNRIQRFQIENEARVEKSVACLYALLDITAVMPDETGLESVFDHAAETCAGVFTCDLVSLMLFHAESEELVVRSVSGPSPKRDMLGAHRRLGEGISGWAAKRREALLLARGCDLSHYPGLRLNSPAISAAMVVPIVLDDVLFGVINVSSESSTVDYDRSDFRALQAFAQNVGVCIRHAQTLDSMKRRMREIEERTAGSEEAYSDVL